MPLWLGYLDSNQEQLRAAWPVRAKLRIGRVPRNFKDLMAWSLPLTTDSCPVIRADSRLSGGFLVTNLVTRSSAEVKRGGSLREQRGERDCPFAKRD